MSTTKRSSGMFSARLRISATCALISKKKSPVSQSFQSIDRSPPVVSRVSRVTTTPAFHHRAVPSPTHVTQRVVTHAKPKPKPRTTRSRPGGQDKLHPRARARDSRFIIPVVASIATIARRAHAPDPRNHPPRDPATNLAVASSSPGPSTVPSTHRSRTIPCPRSLPGAFRSTHAWRSRRRRRR